MKKLQNNFTTPEQSKRLLELGVPEWTADCVYIIYQKNSNEDYYTLNVPLSHQSSIIDIVEKGNADYKDGNVKFCYCWSVGRLIEIYHICDSPGCSFTFHVCFPNLMNEIMYKLAEASRNGWLNLKKLEE